MKEKLSLQKRSPKLCVLLSGGITSHHLLKHYFDTKPQEEVNRQILVIGCVDDTALMCRFFSTHPVYYRLRGIQIITGHSEVLYGFLWENTNIPALLKQYYPKSFGVEQAIGDVVKRCTRIGEVVRVLGEINYCDVGDDGKKLSDLVRDRIKYFKRSVV